MASTLRNGNLFCTCCGGEHKLILPMAITELAEKSKAFEKLHKNCKQTWVEPTPDQSMEVKQKALFWYNNGEKGSSSLTMYHCLIGASNFAINHPYDGDDFSRCYKLLLFVPEWKTQLHKVAELSKPWSNLIANWEKLTEMHEKEQYREVSNLIYTLIK